jgi:hypothetical protein
MQTDNWEKIAERVFALAMAGVSILLVGMTFLRSAG